MRKVALVLTCLVCAGQARRVQPTGDAHRDSQSLAEESQPKTPDRFKGVDHPLKALASLLMGIKPGSAFNLASPGVIAASSPVVSSKRNQVPLMGSIYDEIMALGQEVDTGPPRVRFAPSPTGVLHIGGARTALFNWMFAKSKGGEMILRMEDTDAERSTKESESAILDGLKWLGVTWDEGPDVGGSYAPYLQSDRVKAGIYKKVIDELVSEGHAYRCFTTKEELDAMRTEAKENNRPFLFKSPWARANESAIQEMLDKEAPYVYRMKVPKYTAVATEDLLLGFISWETKDIGGDFVLARSDGMPLYNLANVVDDSQMNITHVLRAQEHLLNTPKQLLIYEALGLDPPKFGHMPLILATDRSKLSKRHGAVSVEEYQDMGFLASSIVNYFLNPRKTRSEDGSIRELMSLQELVDTFDIEDFSRVSAIFDVDRLKAMNKDNIQHMLSDEEALDLFSKELVKIGVVKEASGEFVRKAAGLLRVRVDVLGDVPDLMKQWLSYPLKEVLQSEGTKKWLKDGSIVETAKLLLEANEKGELNNLGSEKEVLDALVKHIGEVRGAKKGKLLVPLRICLTGAGSGPDMNDLFDMLSSVDDNVLWEHVPLSARVDQLAAEVEALAEES